MLKERNSYAYISTATTTQVLTGQGILKKIIVGTTAAGSIKIIDNITGTTTNLAELQASVLPGEYTFDVAVQAGIRIVTAADSLITVVYQKY